MSPVDRTHAGDHDCLDPETLAAYLDGRVTTAERQRITEHLASCGDCYFVFRETTEARAEVPPVDEPVGERIRRWLRRPWVVWPAVATACAAALTWFVIGGDLLRRWRTSEPELQALVAAVGTDRRIEPRLSGGFAYGPLQVVRSGAGGENASPDVRIAAAQIEKAVDSRRTPQNLAALGVASLVTGKTDEAVSALESATRDAPTDGRHWSDLAAAYLVRAQHDRRLEDLTKALNAADRATRIDPSMQEPWFNRALAIERIGGLREQAKKAWEDYLRVDGTSKWSDEARRHLAALSSQSGANGNGVRRSLLGVREHLINDVLASWAEQYVAGKRDEARASLREARSIAVSLADSTHDPMMRDVVAHIERAPEGSSQRSALAAAYLQFVEAKRLLDANKLDAAVPRLVTVCDRLQALDSPLWAEARLATATAWVRKSDLDHARPLLEELVPIADRHRYAHITGRAHWGLGLILEEHSDLSGSVEQFNRAIEVSRASGEIESVAFVHALLADDLRVLGRAREQWQQYDESLSVIEGLTQLRDINAILSSVSNACLNADLAGAGLVFADAILAVALQAGDPIFIESAYRGRAANHARLGMTDLAMADLRNARSALSHVSGTSSSSFSVLDILAAEGEIARADHPTEAIVSLTDAIDGLQRAGGATQLPTLYLARGRAHEQLLEYDPAEADYLRGIQLFEAAHERVQGERYRSSHYESAWELFAQMILLQASRLAHPDVALTFLERARARTLLEAVSGIDGAGSALQTTPEQVKATLPPNVAIVSYVVLPDRLLTWVMTRARVDFVERATPAARMSSAVESIRAEFGHDQESPSGVEASSELYEALIRPIEARLSGVSTVLFVPDGPLHSVPFAALRNRKTNRYFIQDHAVGIAPSLALSVRRAGFEDSARRGPPTALVIGNPLVRDAEETVENLPEAEKEATEIAGFYPNALLLTGASATKQRFLQEAGRYDIVHFAGHAIQDPEFPWFSRLVLASDSSDASGSLFAHELAGQRLTRVQLVVLAACRTAAGPTLRGEGVLNLARPFMAAGVPWIVGTLWDVDDRASRRLLVAFHREIIAGLEPIEALQRAQISLLEGVDSSLRAPVNWSGFVAIGSVSPGTH